ncbi:hypothetical protein F4775DRAFT_539190 [Biscogniauxia sp. FL1348]|nr:hypothetical protein F4775DRAFT_539190 [Biscogniauxia sp. FL1348]
MCACCLFQLFGIHLPTLHMRIMASWGVGWSRTWSCNIYIRSRIKQSPGYLSSSSGRLARAREEEETTTIIPNEREFRNNS